MILLLLIPLDLISDPYEISNIRREDYETHKGKSEYEDVMQVLSRSDTSRGHQGPAAFLIMASGLDEVKIKKTNLFYLKIIF